ncbi:hypothetical protein [Brevundimonas viscosa]|uniref:Lipoprotein n=1 Tax=Brevundimonas viscosa TaxID=871741 RepID=A0A1I6SA35_9CAUL|nr:hypothetical protein [Brevundimonas viscosa]SFS73802.1 hypothetical protein SAMN05192570_2317 [Brevundimonas viscosa]
MPAPAKLRMIFTAGLLGLAVAGCLEPEVDRLEDPVEKAAYHCRYVLERGIATPAQLRADGVLRRRIATFAEPVMERNGDVVRFSWAAGAIAEDDGSGSHGGDCVMDLTDGQQLVVSATLDGQPLHAGFRF